MSDDDMTIADYLRAAADRVLSGGWQQRGFGNRKGPDGPVCILGAVQYVSGWPMSYSSDSYDLLNRLETWLMATSRPLRGSLDLADWNDKRGRTADEVVALLLIAADEWEARRQ